MTKNFIEDAFTITPKDILGGKYLGVVSGGKTPNITYWMEDDGDSSSWMVAVGGYEPRHLGIEWEAITYGERAYFRCSCGHRSAKLYLPPNGGEFKCKSCHGLIYQLTTFDRNSVAGKTLYQMNRIQKLANSRAKISRIFYNGNYTKRFDRFLGLCDRAGYTTIVNGAHDLKALIEA